MITGILRDESPNCVQRVGLTITLKTRNGRGPEHRLPNAPRHGEGTERPLPTPCTDAIEGTRHTMMTSLIVDNTDAALKAASLPLIQALPENAIQVASP